MGALRPPMPIAPAYHSGLIVIMIQSYPGQTPLFGSIWGGGGGLFFEKIMKISPIVKARCGIQSDSDKHARFRGTFFDFFNSDSDKHAARRFGLPNLTG